MAQSIETSKVSLIRLSQQDNVDVAAQVIQPEDIFVLNDRKWTASRLIPLGFKIANCPIRIGENVVKHGANIGTAIQSIDEGELVHTHNLKSDYLPTYLIDSGCSYFETN